MAFDISQLADRLHAADFHALDLVRHEEFFQCNLFRDLVVPHLDFDAPVQGAPCLGQV